MKKIFAIALALVMVLSMASAFALNNCSGNFSWTCPTTTNYCGKGKVEVVPYVKVNNGCGGYDWQLNNCATAINTEKIYFAIKLTVDANPDFSSNDPDKKQAAYWWAEASLKVTTTGVDYPGFTKTFKNDGLWQGIDLDANKAKEYYYNFVTNQWAEVEDATEDVATLNNFVKEATVTKATKAKVCAELESEHSGLGTWTYGDYTVEVAKNRINFKNGSDYMFVYMTDGKVSQVKTSSAAFAAQVTADFNLNNCTLGTCINEDTIKANFGWEDTDGDLKNCFSWSDKGASVVNPDCTIEIPKTGDVSVVAYAVMALVAAAGAMGLKK